ncbi:MAG: NAD-binding protein [Geodermatophilaceae bacterium]|nr:NAD-binding protein [Geodermatophilaceae bacterium]
MGSIVVCGGSVIGLSVAMMLAADGHQVTVLEANPQGVPADSLAAWDSWERKGVAQFHQPHTLFARFRQILDEELPGMVEKLVAAGGEWMDPLDPLPRMIGDPTSWPDDERFRSVTGRRPMPGPGTN